MFKKLLIAAIYLAASNAFAYANVELRLDSINTYVGEDTKITGELEYGIQNNTHEKQHYKIKYILCAENKDCLTEEFSISLNSTEREQKKIPIARKVKYYKSQVFQTSLDGSITGESKSRKSVLGTVSVYPK